MPVEPGGRDLLDFVVIGTQKGGTTSLWQYLREHPRIRMPRSKEAPFFVGEDASPDELASYVGRHFRDAPADALLGKVTPAYMIGLPGADVQVVAERIAAALPKTKLIAVLRDPIERAVSSYMMAVRRGQEKRSVDAALTELLAPDQLAKARLAPTPTNSYVAPGEYGRVLGAYRAFFPAERLLVLFTQDLAREPAAVLDEVLGFIGLPAGFRPEGLGTRHFRGGMRKLLDPEAERLLFKFHREEILPHLRGDPDLHRGTFGFFYETWNVAPDDEPPEISTDTRAGLESHFRRDAERLAELGVSAPWIAGWA
jgi:Sulfotransferase domain